MSKQREKEKKAIELYEKLLFMTHEEKTYLRYKYSKDIREYVEAKKIHLRDYSDMRDFSQSKDLTARQKIFNIMQINLIGDFIKMENLHSKVETPIPFQMFAEESRERSKDKYSENELYELFEALPENTKIGQYLFIGITTMKEPSWTDYGRHKVAIWRDIKNKNALSD